MKSGKEESRILGGAGDALMDALALEVRGWACRFGGYPEEIWITPTMEVLLQSCKDSRWPEKERRSIRDETKFQGMTPHWDADDFRLA